MAVRCAVVIRGTRIPLSVASNSRMALGSGVVVPIPTLFCAVERNEPETKAIKIEFLNKFFIFVYFSKV
jgi:hypothetical protein